MAVANGTPTNKRLLLDQNFITTITAPNAANQVNGAGFDLTQATPYPTTDRIDVNIVVPAGVTGANNKNINIWLQDSADNGNWTNTAYLANPLFLVTDNGNTNVNVANVFVKLQPGGQRYIRMVAKGEANGSPGTGTITFQLVF